MHPYHVIQVVVVDLPVLLPLDHDVPRVQDAHVFQHAVVRLFGEVEDRVGEQLAGQIQPVHVAFRPARCNVSPGFLRRDPQQTRETFDYLPLEGVGVALVVAGMKWVADVVERVFEKGH